MQTDAKTGCEVAVEHFLAMGFENFRLGEAAEKRLPHLHRVDASLRRKHQRFADYRNRRANDHLICRFGDLSCACVTNMDDIFS